MKNLKIIIAGGTGFIGQGITNYFGKENEIIILGRRVKNHENNSYNNSLLSKADGYNVTYVNWNPAIVDDSWSQYFNGADLVINLAGKSVNCRYHKKQKKAIIESRVNATRSIGEAIRTVETKPKLWINAASATIYRNTFEGPQDEFNGIISDLKNDNMPYSFLDRIRYHKNKTVARIFHGKNSKEYSDTDLDFSVQVCKIWEQTFFEEITPGVRKVAMRTAITLGNGGVITPYLRLCKFGLGGKHGNGDQMFSWVHIEDVCRMIEWFWNNEQLQGIFNCAAPEPVTNKVFMEKLRKYCGVRFGLPAPAALLELGAFLIRTETELMLKSRWVVSTKAINQGFNFKYDTIDKAIWNRTW